MLTPFPRFFRAALIAASLFALLGSCKTAPSPTPDNSPPDIVPLVTPTPQEPKAFDATTISEEVRQTTFVDIRKFMEVLNAVIQTKDYETWNSYLTDSYRDYYSRPDILAELSNQSVIKRQGIVLKTLKDYFINVVFPSRQNNKVDEIEFIDQTKVKAFTISAKGDRLVLYILEKIGDTWKISRQ